MRFQLLTTLTLFAGVMCAAQNAQWTYTDCVNYARQNNISLQKIRLNEQTSAYNLEEAQAQWHPTLDFATTQGYANYPWGESAKNTYSSSYGLNAGWTVWNGGLRENSIKRNELQQKISQLATGDAIRTLETDLLQVYINILYARESIGIYEEAVKLSEAQADRAKQLWDAGRLSKVDYAQLKSQYEQDRYALVDAKGIYDTRRMELKKLLELGIDTDIEPADVEWTAEQVLATLPPIDESYKLAVINDLQLQSLDLEKDGSELDINIAKASGKPTIALKAGVGTGYNAPGIGFGSAMRQSFGENIGLTLSVPILDNKKTRTAVAKAKIQRIDAELNISQRQTDVAQLVENWYINTRSAQSKYIAANEQLEAATLTNELTNEQFTLGLVNTIELMTAHNDLVQARHALLQAKYMAMLGQKMIEYYRTAEIALN